MSNEGLAQVGQCRGLVTLDIGQSNKYTDAGLAHLAEQLQPSARVEAGLVAVVGERQPGDVLHDEEGPPVRGRSGIWRPRLG